MFIFNAFIFGTFFMEDTKNLYFVKTIRQLVFLKKQLSLFYLFPKA
jgi:hypothetical protein